MPRPAVPLVKQRTPRIPRWYLPLTCPSWPGSLAAPPQECCAERAEPDAAASPAHKLSRREREVLQLISEGKSTRHIALALSLSEKTVAAHRSHIMHKLRVKSVAELTKIAIREGLTFVET